MDAGPAHSRASPVHGGGQQTGIREQTRIEQGCTPSSSSRACSTQLRHDSLTIGTSATGTLQIPADRGDTVMGCSTWTAEERLARKKEGNETGRDGIKLTAWMTPKGRQAGDASTSYTQDAHYMTQEGTSKTNIRHGKDTMETSHTRYPRPIWAPGHWTHSTGMKRRVYVPDEQRKSKRYGQKNRQMELITYNAMHAANWLRMQDISHTFPRGVIGIQGAKQKRGPEAPAYRTRKTGGTLCSIFLTPTRVIGKADHWREWQFSSHMKWRPTYQ